MLADVRALAETARQQLGPVRLEWVHDGSQAWVVQLHIARQFFAGASIVSAGEADRWLDFEVADGLDSLRELVGRAQAESARDPDPRLGRARRPRR